MKEPNSKVEVVNWCIVNALRIDEDHRMMIIEPLLQSLTDENRVKVLRLFDVKEQSEQLVCENCCKVEVEEQGDWCNKCLGIETDKAN